MAFVKGKSGNPAGRPKGTAHKIINAIEIMQGQGFCPILKAIEMINDPEVRHRERAELVNKLMDKYTPNLKSIEHSGDVGAQYALNIIYPTKDDPEDLDEK